jgi:hypothetical protein
MSEYIPGSMYRQGWEDRKHGRPCRPAQTSMPILVEEYSKGYNDCHSHILETEKNSQIGNPLHGHPFYQEAHSETKVRQVFLSD